MTTLRPRAMALLSIATVPLWVSPSAAAGECSPSELTCVVEEVVSDDVSPDAVVDGIEETAEPTRAVVQEVEGLVGSGVEVPPIDGGGEEGEVPGDGGDRGGGGSGWRGTTGHGIQPAEPSGGGLRSAVSSTEARSASIGSGPGVVPGIGTIAEVAARSLVVALILLGVAIGFVLIQNAIDRRDPKVALAPLESDVVRFA